MQTFSSALTATGRFWLSVNLSVFYSPNKIILLFNIKHPYQMGGIEFSSLGTDPAVDGRKRGGRSRVSCVTEWPQPLHAAEWGCAGCSSDANVRRGDSNHLHSLPPSSVHLYLLGNLQAAHLLFTCRNSACSVQSWADVGILLLKTTH